MSRNIMLVGIIILVIVLGVLFFSYVSRQPSYTVPTALPTATASVSETPLTSPTESSSPATKTSVSIKKFAFDPASVAMDRETEVTWTNDDSVPHTVTGDNGVFNSPTLQPGDNFSFTFKTAGDFSYHCSLHPNMQGTVKVTK